ncbi:hypothetical protein KFL_001700180 [Klebsormidium nitens]|uniref:Uncharacterized protein n=1 Tax=Klebsormidium nitens TaxID=105231 RepID=A0A1Y1I0I3_KLENI|nr:hypothetical protein KFL_001700180 [Klebsormidium nitens]|eukprot:GAQ83963.1 hypothetical protein KFL_001700180 [Klebsormidium nitens]
MAFFFRLLPGCRAALRTPQRSPSLVRHLSLFDRKLWSGGRQKQTSDDAREANKPGQRGANVKHTGEKGSSRALARVATPVSAANKELSLESGVRPLNEVHPGAVLSEVVVTSTEHEKLCAMCLKLRSRRDFKKLRSSPDGVHYLCRGCLSQVSRARRRLAAVVPKGQAYCPCCGESRDLAS